MGRLSEEAAAKRLRELRMPNQAGEREPDARRSPKKHPKGFEPGVAWDGNSGTLTLDPIRADEENGEPTADAFTQLLVDNGFDPEKYAIRDDSIQFRTWQSNIGDGEVVWFKYYRATIVRKGEIPPDKDLVALMNEVRRQRRPKKKAPVGDEAYVLCLSDWQVGKRDGDGVTGLVRRVAATIEDSIQRIKELRKINRQLGTCYLIGLGDLVEGCGDHYPMGQWSIMLDRREQMKVARRLLIDVIKAHAPLFEKVVVVGIGGNHGENRKDGKAFTTFGDNDDVALFEMVAEVIQENPDTYGHVSFVIPRDELAVTLDICGTVTSITHGHIARMGGGGHLGKVKKWWDMQAAGMQPPADATLLLTGHGHHFTCVEYGIRWHIQAPALDGGSDWWTSMTGQASRAGSLSLVVGPNGHHDVEVIGTAGVQADPQQAARARRIA